MRADTPSLFGAPEPVSGLFTWSGSIVLDPATPTVIFTSGTHSQYCLCFVQIMLVDIPNSPQSRCITAQSLGLEYFLGAGAVDSTTGYFYISVSANFTAAPVVAVLDKQTLQLLSLVTLDKTIFSYKPVQTPHPVIRIHETLRLLFVNSEIGSFFNENLVALDITTFPPKAYLDFSMALTPFDFEAWSSALDVNSSNLYFLGSVGALRVCLADVVVRLAMTTLHTLCWTE